MSTSHNKSHTTTHPHDTVDAKAAGGAEHAHGRPASAEAAHSVTEDPTEPSLGSAPTVPGPMLPLGKDFEDAEAACKRVEDEALAIPLDELSPQNIDVVSATSIILGVAGRVLGYRRRMKALPEFDMRNVEELVDRAKASWYVAITNLPPPEPKEYQAMLDEGTALRQHFLTWAVPLVSAQKFDQAALDQIKEGSGNKDTASDVVALVTLYRSKWHEVRGMCGVTEAELERGAVLGPALFSAISRRENKALPSTTDGSLRVRRFWTLADRAYDQCQRAVAYFEWGVGDVSTIAPSLRRNSGTRTTSPVTPPPAPLPLPTPAPAPVPAPVTTAALGAVAAPNGPQLGGAAGPFAR